MLEQRVRRVADQVRRGLVAGDEQQHDELHHVELVEHAVARRIDEHAHEIVARLAAPLADGLAQVQEQLGDVLQRGGRGRAPPRRARHDGDESVAPALEIGPAPGVDAEHLRDDRHGQGDGEVLDHVERLAAARACGAALPRSRARAAPRPRCGSA